jgi:hypothetical protein
MVANELLTQEEEEVVGVINDVQGFLRRPDGVPSYISKDRIFSELGRVVKNPSVSVAKKAEAISVSSKLLKSIAGRKNRRKNSHASSEVSACLDIILPVAICQLPSKEAEIQQASLRLIQDCLQDDDPNSTVVTDTIEHLADNGIRHKSEKISIETMKLLPGIFMPDIDVSV